jgi:hypothetical protein
MQETAIAVTKNRATSGVHTEVPGCFPDATKGSMMHLRHSLTNARVYRFAAGENRGCFETVLPVF